MPAPPQTQTLALPALARWEATLPGIGHVYDTRPGDETPDSLTSPPADSGPTVLHLGPVTGRYNIGRTDDRYVRRQHTTDTDHIESWFVFSVYDQNARGTVQRLARDWMYAWHALLRAHTELLVSPTLPWPDSAEPPRNYPTVWQVIADSYTFGPQDWGGITYAMLKQTCVFYYENAMPTGT